MRGTSIFTYFVLILDVLAVAGVAVFAVHTNTQNQAQLQTTLTKVTVLQNQVAALSTTLESSLSSSTELRTQFQSLKRIIPSAPQSQEELITSAVAKSSPAVVSIVISKDEPLVQIQYVDPFGLNGASGILIPIYKKTGSQPQNIGAGSGFIIRSNGYILTNKHVVSDSGATYTVLLSTGEKKTAKVMYRDPDNDLAIIKIDGTGYPVLPLGDSSQLKLGESVIAIGNALGEYNNSVSVGIISGMNRSITAQDAITGNQASYTNVLQTDAAINPGNSGGPLIDLSGKAVGINVATANANNVSFSIPVNSAKGIITATLP